MQAENKLRNEASFQQGAKENWCCVVFTNSPESVCEFTLRKKKWKRKLGALNSPDIFVIIRGINIMN